MTQKSIEENITAHLKRTNVSMSKLAHITGLDYMAVYNSLANKSRDRPLKATEFMVICEALGVSAEKFYKN